MVYTLVWIFICVMLATLLKQKPHFVLLIIMACYAIFPSVAQQTRFFSPAQYLTLVFTLSSAINGTCLTQIAMRRHARIFAVDLIACVWILVVAVTSGISMLSGIRSAFSIFLFPTVYFALSSEVLNGHLARLSVFVRGLFLLVSFQLALGWMQFQTGRALIWEENFEAQWWWGPNFIITQPVGTFGHWIPYSSFLAGSMFIVTLIRPSILRYIILAATAALLVLAASRTGLLILAIAAILLIIRELASRRPSRWLLLLVAAVPLVISAMNLLSTPMAAILLRKLQNDKDSTTYRVLASDWFWQHLGNFLLSGSGDAVDLRSSGVLNSSLENAFYNLSYDWGLVVAVMLLATMVCAFLKMIRNGGPYRATACALALAMFIPMFTYGSFSFGWYSDLIFFWFAVAMGSAKEHLQASEEINPVELPNVAGDGSYPSRLASSSS